MAAFGDDQVGRVLGGRYRLIAPVGTGSSATVYVADDVQLQRRVALKVLHPSLAEDVAFLKRFRAEAQAAAALGHPNVMAVYDWGQDGEEANATPYLVLEYLAGGSLRSMLDRGRLLTPSQALLVGLEAARGLDYAHRRGFVHRDIKPANLLFGEDRRLRIADFGLARAIAEAAWTEPDGVVLGTARYASPEQARGLAVDGKTDVYSLTLTLIESVTGQVPFAADTTVATLMNRLDKLMPVSAELGPLAPGAGTSRPPRSRRALRRRRTGPRPRAGGRAAASTHAAAAGADGPAGVRRVRRSRRQDPARACSRRGARRRRRRHRGRTPGHGAAAAARRRGAQARRAGHGRRGPGRRRSRRRPSHVTPDHADDLRRRSRPPTPQRGPLVLHRADRARGGRHRCHRHSHLPAHPYPEPSRRQPRRVATLPKPSTASRSSTGRPTSSASAPTRSPTTTSSTRRPRTAS